MGVRPVSAGISVLVPVSSEERDFWAGPGRAPEPQKFRDPPYKYKYGAHRRYDQDSSPRLRCEPTKISPAPLYVQVVLYISHISVENSDKTHF
jgi:hypothetical protein